MVPAWEAGPLPPSPTEGAHFRVPGVLEHAGPAALAGAFCEGVDLSRFLSLIPNLSGLVKFDGD